MNANSISIINRLNEPLQATRTEEANNNKKKQQFNDFT